MGKGIRPRALVHRGVVEASGLLFDTRRLPLEKVQQRILAQWSPGAALYRVTDGYLLRFPVARHTACETASGAPLVLEAGCLLAAPLSQAEMAALAPPQNALIRVDNGVAVVEALEESARADPAEWISPGAWQALPLASLGLPPVHPQMVAEPVVFDPRARLPGIPPADPQRAEALTALRRAQEGKTPEGPPASAGIQEAAGRLLQRMAAFLKQRRGQPGAGPVDAERAKRTLVVSDAPSRPPEQSLVDRLADQMNHLAARMLVASGLARQIGQKQAAYMDRMMTMFERGALDEALRHAIGLSDLGEGKPGPPMLTTPKPRADLTITPGYTRARSALHTGQDLFDQLRQLYRKAFQKLEAEGRIDEAAFVLAELLHVHEEAVAFLERHGRIRLAAEMAEARHLPPGLVIRLWFLAGDRERAARIARKTGAFADAVTRMQRVDAEKAQELRLFWAASLVEAGDYGSAIEALWPEVALRPLTPPWIDRLLELGGPQAARMLARKLQMTPAEDKTAYEQARSLLEDERAETALERRIFAAELQQGATTPQTPLLARLAVRALLRDGGNGYTNLAQADLQTLLRLAGDGALRSDLPPMPAARPRGLVAPFEITVAAQDVGSLAVYDAALLPGGKSVVALGEAGVRLLSREGRTLVHFEQPAHRLVISDLGDRALVLAPRGEVWRMARIDFATRRAEAWREAAFRAFADSYDGGLWFVSVENDLTAIDAASRGFDALWRMPHLEGGIVSLARSATQCSFLLYEQSSADAWGRPALPQGRMERWTYALPALLLRDRPEVPLPSQELVPGQDLAMGISSEGLVLYLTTLSVALNAEVETALFGESKNGEWFVVTDPYRGRLFTEPCAAGSVPLPPVFTPDWAALATVSARGVCCRVFDRKEWKVRARFTLDGASTVSLRFLATRLTLADDRGRLLALDLDRGELLRNLRLRG